jgi:hypothetical protein
MSVPAPVASEEIVSQTVTSRHDTGPRRGLFAAVPAPDALQRHLDLIKVNPPIAMDVKQDK